MTAAPWLLAADQVAVLRARNLDGRDADSNVLACTGPLEPLRARWASALPPPLQYLAEKHSWAPYDAP